MRESFSLMVLFLLLISVPAMALDPVAPRSERRFGMIYVETPNSTDKISITNQRTGEETKDIKPLTDVKVQVGDYEVLVKISPKYSYTQHVTVRPTERHEIIVPGFGNVRVNGACKEVIILKEGKEVTKIKCNEVRTLPRGPYDLKIKIGKYTLDQSVTVVTNTLREVDVKR